MMKPLFKTTQPALGLLSLVAAAILASEAHAHITYTNRNFGTFTGNGSESPVSITNQTVSGNFGWADGTDSDYGDSHRLRAFRFSLLNPAQITLSITANLATSLLPAFSIYQGLAHLPPEDLDHDGSLISQQYLASISNQTWDGSFNALGNWAIGNNQTVSGNVVVPASLSYFTYVGHAADGTAANYGSNATSAVNGDGTADGFVTGTFNLAAGNYSVFIGGANYSAIAAGPFTAYGFQAALSVIPEPGTAVFAGLGAVIIAARRRRKR